MAAELNLVRFNPTAGGLTDWTFSTIVAGHMTPTLAGAVNGKLYKVHSFSADQSQWELSEGAYNSATGVFARTAILYNSSGTGTATGQSGAGTKINFTTVPQCSVVMLKEDSLLIDEASSWSTAQKKQARTNIAAVLSGQLFGLTLSMAGASSTFGIAAGEAADSTGVDLMVLATAYTKTTGAWAVGTASGSLDTGAIAASTTYHFFLIKRPDTNVVDFLISLSPTAPTLPANYTLFRRVGSRKTDGSSQWVKCTQNGDEVLLDVSVLDVNAGAITTTNTVYALGSIPTGIPILAFLRLVFTNTTAVASALVSSAMVGPQIANTPTGNSNLFCNGAGQYNDTEARIWTNTSAQVNASGSNAANNQLFINTFGWSDRRGRDA